MKRIGLYLGAEPSSGGAFQYGQTMLEALSLLPRKEFSIYVRYSSLAWADIIAQHDVENSFFSSLNSFERNTALWWRRFGLPTSLWRNAISRIHPFSQRIVKTACDLWIFPAQDIWSYRVPTSSLTTVYDLMHRYEKRFSEVSTYGRYLRREQHYRDICRWSKGILVDSNVGKQQLIESYNVQPDKVHVLPFISPKYILQSQKTEDFDSRYDLPGKFLFYPSQFWSHKNHKRLIEAIAMLKKELPDIKMVFVGAKKNGYNAAYNLVNDLRLHDSVFFLGYVPDEDIAEIYKRARALIMPTFFGPTNIPPLEAFAVNCPVAVSKIYGMPEQVADAALLFNPNSTDEIASSIRRLWTDDELCKTLVEKGQQRFSSWGIKQFTEKLLSIIRIVLNNNS